MERSNDAMQSHQFTCNSCQVAFRSSELQRTHMQSEWHRYNLKRRVASLPPITSEVFADKVSANKASAAATAAKASFEKACTVCHKTYYSENAYANHLGSQKHKQALKKPLRSPLQEEHEVTSMKSSTFSLGSPIETDSVGTEKAEDGLTQAINKLQSTTLDEGTSQKPAKPSTADHPMSETPSEQSQSIQSSSSQAESRKATLQRCLFCNHVLASLDESIEHMERSHGMFIPEQEYLVEREGLILHLAHKIAVKQQCLFCGQVRHTVTGVQAHMREKGHCMIPFEEEADMLDIGGFYDFRSTYSDTEEDSDEADEPSRSGPAKLGGKRETETTVETEDGDLISAVDDEDWESDSTLSSVPTEEITAIPISDFSHRYRNLDRHRHHSHIDTRPHHHSDGYHSHAHSIPHAVYHDEYELHMPSGRTAGHRSLNKYFRQNLRNHVLNERGNIQRALTSGPDVSDSSGDEHSDSEQRDSSTPNQTRSVARRRGDMGMIGVTDAKKREIQAVEKREQRQGQRIARQYEWGVQKRANHQKHFRDPLLQ